jgi:hypothetical protein
MTFNEAINTVILTGKTVWRRQHYHDHNYGDYTRPWSEWMRIRIEEDTVDFDALLFFETNYYDEVKKKWTLMWAEDNVSKADSIATDWKVVEEQNEYTM